MSPALYRDTKLPSCSQAHLGFYDTHIYGIFMSTYRTFRETFYAGSQQSSLANASTFWQSVRSFPRDVMLSKRVVKRVSLGLNFNQLPLKAVDKWSAAQVLWFTHISHTREPLYIFKRLRPCDPSLSLSFFFSYLGLFHFFFYASRIRAKKRTKSACIPLPSLVCRDYLCKMKIKTRNAPVDGICVRSEKSVIN